MHRRRLPTVLAAVSCTLALAACGGSSKPSSTGNQPSSTSASPTGAGSPSRRNTGSPSSFARSQLKWAACIRKHGIPDFPDPTFGAGGAQVNLHVPAGVMTQQQFMSAQKACANLGLVGAGYSPTSTATAAEMAQALAIARCLRAHGVPNWPDPSKILPSNIPSGYGVQQAVPGPPGGPIFLIPMSINLESPAAKQAQTACHRS